MKQLIFSLFLICLYSCSSGNKSQMQQGEEPPFHIIDLTEIEYSDKPLKLSEFVDSIEYIRLDETPLLPALYNTGITITEDAIYIEKSFIYKYNLKGNFIKSLFTRGQGPSEANKATKAAFDLKNNKVAVNNNFGSTFRIYTLDGEHIGDVPKANGRWYKTIIAYANGYEVYRLHPASYPLRGDSINLDGPYFIYAKDTKTDSIIYQQPNYHYNIKAIAQNGMLREGGYPLCYDNQDGLFWWKHQSVDTIYCTTDFSDVRPWYVIKKNKSFADYEFCVHRMVLDVPVAEYRRRMISGAYPLGNGVLFNVTGIDNGGVGYCKNDGKALRYSSKGFINDVDEHFKFWMSYRVTIGDGCVKDGYLYTLMNAFDFFEEGAKPPFPDLTEESNPVIVKFKLKK